MSVWIQKNQTYVNFIHCSYKMLYDNYEMVDVYKLTNYVSILGGIKTFYFYI